MKFVKYTALIATLIVIAGSFAGCGVLSRDSARENMNNQLYDAVLAGDTEKVRSLVAAGADVNAGTMIPSGKSEPVEHRISSFTWLDYPWIKIHNTYQTSYQAIYAPDHVLPLAAKHNNLEIVNILLAAGAGVNTRSVSGQTALITASEGGHTEIVRVLLAAKADVNAKTDDGVTALMGASVVGPIEIVRALLAAGADVKAKNNDGDTALIAALTSGEHTDIVRALLSAGADVNAANNSGVTALIRASSAGQADAVEVLLASGADVNARNKNGDTALSEMTRVSWSSGSTEVIYAQIVRALIAAGADVNVRNNYGNTALKSATAMDHQVIIQLLKDAGARP